MAARQHVVLVTGGMGGLGETISTKMVDAGYKVVVTYSPSNTKSAEWIAEMKKNGYDITAVACDVADFDSCTRAVAEVQAKVGAVDILVNNAGILLDETFAKSKESNWDKVIRVHLKGTYCCTIPVFKWQRENGGGVIVNTSSTSGLIGNFGQTNYGAAKGGIWGLSNVLAIEGRKYNIRIWTLAPGALTRMTADLPRYIENPKAALGPDGIAPAVLYMVSELSGDQTGKTLGVSGPRGVREMRMMEMDGWKPPGEGWKAEDVVTHAKEIFFSEEQIKMGARRF